MKNSDARDVLVEQEYPEKHLPKVAEYLFRLTAYNIRSVPLTHLWRSQHRVHKVLVPRLVEDGIEAV